MLQDLFPGIHECKTLKKAKIARASYFHNCGKTVENTAERTCLGCTLF
jgi:hypothetical protein